MPEVSLSETSGVGAHIVLLLASGNPTFTGGVPGQVLSRAKYLTEHGFQVSIIARGNPDWHGVQQVSGITVYALLPRDLKLGKWIEKQWFHPLLGIAIEEFLPKLHRAQPIDHLLIFDSQAGVPAIKFAEKNGITTQFSIHGSALLPYTLPPLLRRLSPSWEKICYQKSTLIAPIGEAIGAHCQAHFKTDRPIKILRNGLNPVFFDPSSTVEGTQFLFVGRFEPDKRPLAMLDALESGVLTDSIQIKILGEGSLRTEIMSRSESSKRNHQITVPPVGAKNADEMKAAYRSAQCLVWTAIAEAMAVAPLEAMAMGVPVIAPRIESAVELLGDNYPAMVDIDDIPGLAKMMNKVEADADFRQQLREIGFAKSQQFHPDVAYQALIETVNELVAQTRANRASLR